MPCRDCTDMRREMLLLLVFGSGVPCLAAADPPPQGTGESEMAAADVRKLTEMQVIQLALVEAHRRNLDLRDVEAQSATFHTTEGNTTWYVYFQNKVDNECRFVILIDDRTAKAEPGTRKCG